MRISKLLATVLVLAAHTAGAEAPICLDDAPVCIETEVRGPNTRFVVTNRSQAPYSVRIVPSALENLKPLTPPPFRGVVEPGDRRVVGSLVRIDSTKQTDRRFRWHAAVGSMLARHDGTWQYRMPFGGTRTRTLTQGIGGRDSHTGGARYGFDFGMPWGTPVLAARAGVVIEVVDEPIAGGTSRRNYDESNRVQVLHRDGTVAMYAHLRHGTDVDVGQRVETGAPIGRSGDTGLAHGPHLHFMVWRRTPELSIVSLPIRFHDGSAGGLVPTPGLAYAPACATNGSRCEDLELPPSESAHPAARDDAGVSARRTDGGCECANGAVVYVDLPCRIVCGR